MNKFKNTIINIFVSLILAHLAADSLRTVIFNQMLSYECRNMQNEPMGLVAGDCVEEILELYDRLQPIYFLIYVVLFSFAFFMLRKYYFQVKKNK